jgi:hypothetical protein
LLSRWLAGPFPDDDVPRTGEIIDFDASRTILWL